MRALILLLITLWTAAAKADPVTLNLFIWSEYIDPHPSKPIATQSPAKAETPTRSAKKATRAKTKVAKGKAVKARKKKARR